MSNLRSHGQGARDALCFMLSRPDISAPEARRFIVADRQAIVCQGVAAMLEPIAGVEVAARVCDIRELRSELAGLRPGDGVILGTRLVDGELNQALELIGRQENLMLVVIAGEDELSAMRMALEHGVEGLCSLDDIGAVLPGMVANLSPGQSQIPTALMRRLASQKDEVLSRREGEILRLISDGLTNFQIASRLGLSENTVKYYVKQIYQKLQVSSRSQATAKFVSGQY